MIRAFLWFLVQIPLILIGPLVVACMIPFRKTDEATRTPYTQYPQHGDWVFTNFPGWWGNPCDGLLGDKRGWWANYCREHYGLPETDWRCMVMWAGFRNPLNAMSRLVIGVDVSRCVIDKVWGDDSVIEEPGQGGKQYLIARRDDGKTFPRLFVVLPYWFDPTHAVLIDIGWKIKLSHNGTPKDVRLADRAKGIVSTLSPWKTLV